MEKIITDAPVYLEIASFVVMAASGIANLTKTDSDNIWIARIGKLINFFALNFRTK